MITLAPKPHVYKINLKAEAKYQMSLYCRVKMRNNLQAFIYGSSLFPLIAKTGLQFLFSQWLAEWGAFHLNCSQNWALAEVATGQEYICICVLFWSMQYHQRGMTNILYDWARLMWFFHWI